MALRAITTPPLPLEPAAQEDPSSASPYLLEFLQREVWAVALAVRPGPVEEEEE